MRNTAFASLTGSSFRKALVPGALVASLLCWHSAISAADGWIVGGQGVVLKSDDLGESWTPQSPPTSASLNSVYFLNDKVGWVAGGQVILKTTNGGSTWVDKYTGSASLNSVHFPTPDVGYAVGSTGAMVKSTNGGENWSSLTSPTTADLNSVYFISADVGWAAGGQVILKTEDGGDHWTDFYSGGAVLRSVFFVDESYGWAVGSTGTILKSTDGGEHWNTQTSGVGTELLSVHFIDRLNGWTAGPQVILRTTNGGSPWTDRYFGGAALQSVFFLDGSTGWAVGTAGAVEKSVNGGFSWTPRTSGSSQTLKSVHFVDCSDADEDGFYEQPSCGTEIDCDDGNPDVNPDGTEICNGIDDDCDDITDNGGDALCDDSDHCTTDTCNGYSGCQFTSVNCDDDNVCTDDSCVPATGCVYTNNTDPCSDDNICTTTDTCSGGVCVGGPPLDCDDDDVCTADSCNSVSGCVHVFQDADSDTVCDAEDCAPNDSGAFAIPGEITGFVFAPDTITMSWDSAVPGWGTSTVHDVLRGALSEFPIGSGASEICLDPGISAATTTDSTPLDPNHGFWYVVRGRNVCGSGTYGTRSNGTQRVSSACP